VLFWRGVFLIAIPIIFTVAACRAISQGRFVFGKEYAPIYILLREANPDGFKRFAAFVIFLTVILAIVCLYLLLHPPAR
jgi:hypothetical protein